MHRFMNALRILKSLDAHEVGLEGSRWLKFRDDPVGFLIRADDSTANAIWLAIESRQPARGV